MRTRWHAKTPSVNLTNSAVHRPIFQPFSATMSSPLKKAQSPASKAKSPKGKEKSSTPDPASPAADESSEPIDGPLLAGAHWGQQVRFIYISPSVWFPRGLIQESLTVSHLRISDVLGSGGIFVRQTQAHCPILPYIDTVVSHFVRRPSSLLLASELD